ncbi:hypothetical protein Cme02nite_13440 [Catellatospora methionotrophica]|uniref:Uncharacterized protein n=1 Tax=Catellatospora methionotrophica TaxID=121620 RepID=A0A8J3L6F0_9ACTN|nr:hypothetical protein [Catellatospora methionotrophica]GIG13012.1 hypothetical protein Cme02nite_13440 [Catellatospora methionotrophica]
MSEQTIPATGLVDGEHGDARVSALPRLAEYTPHRIAADVDLEGHVVPGLTGEFFRKPEDGRTATVGLYRYLGSELFMAWGYVDEEHCRWTAYRRTDGDWGAPHPGCPQVRHSGEHLELDLDGEKVALRTTARSGGAGSGGCAAPPPAVRDSSHTADSGSLPSAGSPRQRVSQPAASTATAASRRT